MGEDNNDGTKCSFTEQLIMSPYADTTFTQQNSIYVELLCKNGPQRHL